MKDIYWINAARAIGIVSVYIYHTEEYFGKGEIAWSFLFMPFFMAIFFWVSGYLFFNPNKEIYIRAKLKHIFTKMIWPYFIFCSIIYFPKMIVRGNGVSLSNYAYEIIGGHASWFICSLVVCQLIILLGYRFIKDCRVWSLIGFLLLYIVDVCNVDGTGGFWHYKSAFMALPIFSLGGVFRLYEKQLNKFVKASIAILLFFLYLVVICTFGESICFTIAKCNHMFIAIFTTILGIGMLVVTLPLLPYNKLISYIGSNTLPMYFLSGGIPMLLGIIGKHLLPEPNYFYTVLVAFIGIAFSLGATWIINRNFSWMLNMENIRIINHKFIK